MKTLTCPIASIEYYNHDTRRVLLDLPDGESADFKAGQYLQLVLPHKKCPFSIASSPRITSQIELHVRPTPGSEDSVAIEKALDGATSLTVELPLGDCFITQTPTNPLLLLAASTGVTQMKSIIEFL
ncbi:MAG: FAD-binding oxidoreductase, partial [Pseudomonadales bacterium]